MKIAKFAAFITALLIASPNAGAQPAASTASPTTIYAVSDDGSLKWYRHLAPLTAGGLESAASWDQRSGKEVGIGWTDSIGVFTGGEGVIYSIFPNGDLYWYKHDGYRTGGGLQDPGAWNAVSRKQVGIGWNNLKQVFSTGEGVIYTINGTGELRWYRHLAYRTGGGLQDPGSWDARSGKVVGVGWNAFTKVFAAPGGIIYGITRKGDLRWYKHLAYLTGGGLKDPGSWDSRSGKVIGVGWNTFNQIFAGRNGVIYGAQPDGSLRWYRHLAYRTGGGLENPASWDSRGGKVIGIGWDVNQLFGF